MATTINTGDTKAGRTDLFLVDPEHVIVLESLNGRAYPHEDEAVSLLVESFHLHGQKQPVICRRDEENRLILVLGYRRHAAALEHNRLHPETPMRLACRVQDMNEGEALIANIVENQERKSVTAIDHAHNHRRLRESLGWTDQQIADLYHFNPGYVGKLRNLLRLGQDVQYQIHTGTLSVEAGLALADVPQEAREVIVREPDPAPEAKPEAANGKPKKQPSKSQQVIAKVREVKVEKGKAQARSLSEVRQFFADFRTEDDGVERLCDLLVAFIKGSISDKLMTKRIHELFS